MHLLYRSRSALIRKLPSRIARTHRRSAHDTHDPSHGASHPAPTNESFGRGFYIALGIIPATFLLYRLSRQDTDEKPWLTRFIDSFSVYQEKWNERNTLHTKMVEQAAFDRALFQNSPRNDHVELRFPEIFNSGSQMNVPAGHGGINLDKVIAHYEKKNFAEQERKLKALRDGTLEEQNARKPQPYRSSSDR